MINWEFSKKQFPLKTETVFLHFLMQPYVTKSAKLRFSKLTKKGREKCIKFCTICCIKSPFYVIIGLWNRCQQFDLVKDSIGYVLVIQKFFLSRLGSVILTICKDKMVKFALFLWACTYNNYYVFEGGGYIPWKQTLVKRTYIYFRREKRRKHI